MASPESYPRHEDRIALLVDAYLDACIALDAAILNPSAGTSEVIQVTYLRLATELANEVAGIPSLYVREVVGPPDLTPYLKARTTC